MSRLLLRCVLVCLVALSLLIGSARFLGVYREHPAAALVHQFECSPQPCWAGIHPGITTLAEAENIFNADPTFSLIEHRPTDGAICWNWQPQWHHPVGYRWDGCYNFESRGFSLFMNYENNGLRLGDILPLLDMPTTSLLCTDMRMGWIDTPDLRIYLAISNYPTRITPNLMVSGITYFWTDMTDRPINYGWSGFSRWAEVSNTCNAA